MSKQSTALPADISAVAQQKLIDLMDGIQHGAVTLGNEVIKYTPDVVNAGLDVVRIDAAGCILQGIACTVIACVSYKVMVKCWGKEKQNTNYDIPVNGIAAFLMLLLLCASSILAAHNLLNVWNYIALFEPKLYIAKQLMQATMDKIGN